MKQERRKRERRRDGTGKDEGGRRKEEGGKRKEERGKRKGARKASEESGRAV